MPPREHIDKRTSLMILLSTSINIAWLTAAGLQKQHYLWSQFMQTRTGRFMILLWVIICLKWTLPFLGMDSTPSVANAITRAPWFFVYSIWRILMHLLDLWQMSFSDAMANCNLTWVTYHGQYIFTCNAIDIGWNYSASIQRSIFY